MENLEKRIERLEDVEAIKNALTKYAFYADQNKEKGKQNIEELTRLFTDDGIWEMPGIVYAKGIEELRKFFQSLSDGHEVLVHYIAPPLIEIKGDTANTLSNLLVITISKGTNNQVTGHNFYDIDYVKTKDGWKMTHLKLKSSISEQG